MNTTNTQENIDDWVEISKYDNKELIKIIAERIIEEPYLIEEEAKNKRMECYLDLLKIKDYIIKFYENKACQFITITMKFLTIEDFKKILKLIKCNWLIEGHEHNFGLSINYGRE